MRTDVIVSGPALWAPRENLKSLSRSQIAYCVYWPARLVRPLMGVALPSEVWGSLVVAGESVLVSPPVAGVWGWRSV